MPRSCALTSVCAACFAAIERHVRHARSYHADERRRRRECTQHNVHASVVGAAGVRLRVIGPSERLRGYEGFARVGRDDIERRGERSARGIGICEPGDRQDRRRSGNAARGDRQSGVRRAGLCGGEDALREAAARSDLREHEGRRQVIRLIQLYPAIKRPYTGDLPYTEILCIYTECFPKSHMSF